MRQRCLMLISTYLLLMLCVPAMSLNASDHLDDIDEEELFEKPNEVSPARRIKHKKDRQRKSDEDRERSGRRSQRPEKGDRGGLEDLDVRSLDGTGNNLDDPLMGAAHTALLRVVKPDYEDQISTLAGATRPSPRTVSNIVHAQERSYPNDKRASDFLWQWGQFLDHDIDLTDGMDPPEPALIVIPAGDPHFDPRGTGKVTMAFNRSIYDVSSGRATGTPREQRNEISAWIDGSNVYGSDEERAAALRTGDGTGRLRTSEGGMLPFNTEGLPNAGGDAATLFLAGDVRANEQVGLTALHTLFVREHNWHADRLGERYPNRTGEEIYQAARNIVIAEMQVITYKEYLPALLGRKAIRSYRGYKPNVNARITNFFSTAAYRYGHSALSPMLLRVDEDGSEIEEGHLALRNAFFSPWRIAAEGGLEPILRGLAAQTCQDIDPYVIDDVRNFLFGPPGSGGFDLVSLNIQRGRDHGLPSYNEARVQLGLKKAKRFRDITRDRALAKRLEEAYGHVDKVDAWVGALAEDNVRGAMVGKMVHKVVTDQFTALRDGDRFWYKRTLPRRLARRIERVKLSDIIRRNTEIGGELQDDVFHVKRDRRADKKKKEEEKRQREKEKREREKREKEKREREKRARR